VTTRLRFQHGMVAPLIALFLGVVGFPLAYAFYLSVTSYKLTDRGTPAIVGADNYVATFGDGEFWNAFGTTALYVLVAVGLELIIGLMLALALQKQQWARDLTRSMLLAPMFITPIAVGLVFRFLLNDQLGAIPHLLRAIGIDYDFFGPGRALFTMAFIDVWQWTPFMVLLLLAGLQSIPAEPLEAARVDGASGFYVLRRVTLPLLAPVLVVAILLRCLDAMKVFEYVFATTRGGPGTETETLQYFIYQTGIQFFRLGSASSMAFVVLVVVLTIIVFAFRRMEKARTGGKA
jgi:multiple sugar transport system permease protein